eukprot:2933644-Alexandrium_andersonii.AAC.1
MSKPPKPCEPPEITSLPPTPGRRATLPAQSRDRSAGGPRRGQEEEEEEEEEEEKEKEKEE